MSPLKFLAISGIHRGDDGLGLMRGSIALRLDVCYATPGRQVERAK